MQRLNDSVRWLTVSIAVCAALLTAKPAAAADDYPLRDAVECHPRSGLPNAISKLKSGATVNVAYLGGSITAAAGWRVQSREWLQEKYPQATVNEIHAAIGGTGSDLGVFRLENDVLQHNPDLLFVEFAVNDGGASPERIHQAMEGIVRQTWHTNPRIDICFVYTLALNNLQDLQSGKMQRSATAMEELADHYAIPSIHFGVRVAAMEKSGELVFKADKPQDIATAKPMVFSSDGVHPHAETGHRLYVDAIKRSWPAIEKANSKTGDHALIAPLRKDNWEKAHLVAISPKMLSGQWKKLPADHSLSRRFAKNLPVLYQAEKPGAAISVTFNGTAIAFFDVLGPDGGLLRVELDDRPASDRKRIDGYCVYHRMSKLSVAEGLEPGRHTVKVTLLPDQLDKKSILFERNQTDLEKHPEKYSDHTWYVGWVMVIGDVE